MSIGRHEVIEYLRWLADQPDGINHRAWLFHAALLLGRDTSTTVTPPQERHGDQTT